MSRHSVREIQNSFQDDINENRKVIQKLKDSISSTQSNIRSLERMYDTQVEQFVFAALVPFNAAEVKALSAATNGKLDFFADYQNCVDASDAAEAKLQSLRQEKGTEEENVVRKKQLGADIEAIRNSLLQTKAKVKSIKSDLIPVDAFNKKYTGKKKPLLRADNNETAYFKSKSGFRHFWASLFDGHYKQGRKLVKEFESRGATITGEQEKLQQAQQDEKAFTARHEILVSDRSAVEKTLAEMARLDKASLTHDAIIDQVKENIVRALEKPEVFNAAVTALPENAPGDLVAVRAKIDALGKIEESAVKRLEALEKTTRQLEDNRTKLNRASSSKQVDIDLDKIRKSVKGQRVAGEHAANETKKAAKKVNDYQPSNDRNFVPDVAMTALDIYTQMMIYDMIFDAADSIDAHTLHDTIGISDEVAAGAHIDLDHLTPDFSREMEGLSDTFNNVSDDISKTIDSFEMPDISDTLNNVGDTLSDWGSSISDSMSDFGGGFDL